MALADLILDDTLPAINEDSADHGCFGCGDGNPHGLRLRFRPLRDGGVWARFTPDNLHEGYVTMTHGGILATILDEAMSWAITHEGDLGVTAKLSLAFRQPARVGQSLVVVAHVCRRRGRVIDANATLVRESDKVEIASAEGRFMRVTRAQAAGWRNVYGSERLDSAFGCAVSRNDAELT